jgi:hypothetical protein
MTIYDYIIIGGGISGLYANYKLNKKHNCLLLEKNAYFGGRAYEMDFHGSLIKLGAGIMAEHNKHLIKLLNELKIKINTFPSTISTYGMKDFNMGAAICSIITKYKELKNNDILYKLTMKQFLIKYFGSSFAKQFILNCEYYDFVNSNIEYFIKYYDINDMSHDSYNILIINWTDLVNKLVQKNCLNNIEVNNIEKEDNHYVINNKYYTKKIIFTTSLKPFIRLSKKIININYKDYLGTVPFVRIYCYYKNGYKTNLPHFTIVSNKLQKIIKINDKILMASYCDSNNALYWNKINKLNKEKQKEIVSKYLKEYNINEKIDDIIIAFWDEGVHYYKPMKNLDKTIKKLSHPDKNIYVVGEMISYKQGWVEGCIESVNRFF